jgi:hypothetical protein
MTTVKKKVSSLTYIFADPYSGSAISGPRFSRKAARTALSDPAAKQENRVRYARVRRLSQGCGAICGMVVGAGRRETMQDRSEVERSFFAGFRFYDASVKWMPSEILIGSAL